MIFPAINLHFDWGFPRYGPRSRSPYKHVQQQAAAENHPDFLPFSAAISRNRWDPKKNTWDSTWSEHHINCGFDKHMAICGPMYKNYEIQLLYDQGNVRRWRSRPIPQCRHRIPAPSQCRQAGHHAERWGFHQDFLHSWPSPDGMWCCWAPAATTPKSSANVSGSRPPQISHSMGPDTWGWLFNGPTGRPEVWVCSPDGNLNSEMNQRPHSEATL